MQEEDRGYEYYIAIVRDEGDPSVGIWPCIDAAVVARNLRDARLAMRRMARKFRRVKHEDGESVFLVEYDRNKGAYKIYLAEANRRRPVFTIHVLITNAQPIFPPFTRKEWEEIAEALTRTRDQV